MSKEFANSYKRVLKDEQGHVYVDETQFSSKMTALNTDKELIGVMEVVKERAAQACVELAPIPYKELPNFINREIHLEGAPSESTWILTRIDNQVIHIINKETGKHRSTWATRAMRCITRQEMSL